MSVNNNIDYDVLFIMKLLLMRKINVSCHYIHLVEWFELCHWLMLGHFLNVIIFGGIHFFRRCSYEWCTIKRTRKSWQEAVRKMNGLISFLEEELINDVFVVIMKLSS